MLTKDQLIQYLRVCADLADAPKDGVAHVAIVPLRQAIQLLESSAEPTAEHPALPAGDVLAHQLTFKYHGDILEAWWQARGGHDKCTVCAPANRGGDDRA